MEPAFYLFLKALCSVLGAVVAVCYSYQIIYLIVPLLRKARPHKPAKRNRFAILVAARNEERVLPFLLQSIAKQDYPSELLDVFVIADNCTDATAEIAKQYGATVYTRVDHEKVGKGYALHDLIEHIRSDGALDRYDAFLIFDADNVLRQDYISQINRTCSDGYDAFCGYRNSKNYGDNWVSAGYAIWYLHESTHMNRSRSLLGTSGIVNGTGFGFTRRVLELCGEWKFFTLTEDIEFNTWCVTHGVRVGYCHEAMAYDEQPARFRQSWRQRTRWAQGGLQVAVKYSGQLLRGLFRGGWQTWACFETATLSLWGYGMSAITFGLTMLVTFLAERWLGIAQSLLLAVVTAFLSMMAIGALTLITEWKRIPVTGTGKKLMGLVAFPMFMLSFIPITASAIFRKFEWQQIDHTVAVSAAELQEITK